MGKKIRSATQLITPLLLFTMLTGLGACSQSQAPTSPQSNPVPHGQNLPPKEGKVGQSPGPDEEELGMAAPPKVGKTAEKSHEDVETTGEKPPQEASRNERAANDRNRKPSDQPPDEDIGFSAPAERPEVGQPKMGRSQEDIFPRIPAPPLPMPRMSRPPLSSPFPSQRSDGQRSFPEKEGPIVQKPVYNALFSPMTSRSPLSLDDHKRTTITFYIGPRHAESVLSPKAQQVSSDLLEKQTNITLMVTMKCLVCLENSLQIKPIQYSGSQGQSSSASFDIVPSQEATENKEGFGQITFNISGSGVEYNHIVTCVLVGPTTKKIRDKAKLCEQRSEPQQFSAVVSETSSDLEIVIADRSIGGGIGIALNPHHEKLRQMFNHRHEEQGGVLKIFKTGFTSKGQVEDLVRKGYVQFRQISEQNNKILSQSMEGTSAGAVTLSDSSQVALSDENRDKIATVLAAFGQDLYKQLFLDGDDDLFDLSQLLEQDGLGELRIVIKTAGLYAPWQFLHKTGDIDPRQFWGMKYRLAALPIMRTTQGRLPARISPPTKDGAIFGRYRGNDEKNSVASLGSMQAEQLAGMLKGESHLAVTTSNNDFLAKLKTQSQTLKLVATYSHASSGTAFMVAGNETMIAQTIEGQRLLFAQKEYVQPTDLRRLSNSLSPKEARRLFFALQPLVFLNGCETGTGGVTPTTDASFPGVLVNLGARGVFVTEAPVWELFGFHFGNALMKGLLNGEPSAKALLDARRQFLTKSNNPLGLFYAYYGNPDSGFSLE